MLEVSRLAAGYDGVEALADVSLGVGPRELVALVGANGAGTSTTLRVIAGLVTAPQGFVRFEGETISGWPAYRIARRGIALVTEQLNLFVGMTVMENLQLGGAKAARAGAAARLDRVFALFPILADRRRQLAGTLSGGE